MRRATELKIAGLMREDLDRGLTIMGVSKKLKIGYRPAYNHITSMGREGIVRIETVGNASQCFLNLGNPKCRHLLEEVDSMKKEDTYRRYPKIKGAVEGLVSRLTGDYTSEIHSVVLFGSHAKGTATKTSDIDMLFIVSDLKNRQLREEIERESAGYQYSHNVRVSPLITDVTEFRKMLESGEVSVGREVRGHGISLYGSEMFWRLVAWKG